MNKILFALSWSVALALALTACGSAATSTPDPVTVLQNYYQALTSNDLDKAMSFFADDAVYLDQMARISGKEDIRAWLQGLIDTGQSYEVSDLTNTNGQLEYKIKVSVNDRKVYSGLAVTVVREERSSLMERKLFGMQNATAMLHCSFALIEGVCYSQRGREYRLGRVFLCRVSASNNPIYE